MMRRTLGTVFVLLPCLAVPKVGAKPKSARPACESRLDLTRRAIEEQNLLWLSAYDGLVSLVVIPPREARLRKVRLIREWLEARSTSIALFSPHDDRPPEDDRVIRDARALLKDKVFDRFVTAPMLIVNTLEDFVTVPDREEQAALAARLRQILSERVRNKRPTILTLEDVANAEVHLRNL